jgi:anhydro-N-acetylmuramic acid kinase
MPTPELYIGLMSGTSLDAIDTVLADLAPAMPQLIHTHSHPLPKTLRAQLLALCQPGDDEIERLGHADSLLGTLLAEAVMQLLADSGVAATDIQAIGSHGQTVRHRPKINPGFTLQIGDPNHIAEHTGITTVADFRRRDLAVGGQGAPLVPAFHAAVFSTNEKTRIVLNIGGIANITLLDPHRPATGFDTGPGNMLMDTWIQQQRGEDFDQDGAWAATGQVNEPLLAQLLTDDYFQQAPPKSTGREHFNPDWLAQRLASLKILPATVDVQASLCELTATSIARAIEMHTGDGPREVIVCGGGARNGQLLKRLRAQLSNTPVRPSDELSLATEWVEATAFAWLARETLANRPGNLPKVTGACKPVVLGGIYFGS